MSGDFSRDFAAVFGGVIDISPALEFFPGYVMHGFFQGLARCRELGVPPDEAKQLCLDYRVLNSIALGCLSRFDIATWRPGDPAVTRRMRVSQGLD